MRITDRNDWFEIWFQDRKSMIDTMVRNMQADLDAGYDPQGKSITIQRAMIEEYETRLSQDMFPMAKMTNEECNRWCYYDLKRRGAIE